MKVILDTNVIISGIFFSGLPSRILDAWADGRFELVISPEILSEYQRVGQLIGKKFPATEIAPIIEIIAIKSNMIDARSLGKQFCEDPDDDKFLACAFSSGCGIIVTGDKHLLKMNGINQIQIQTPREFADSYLRKRKITRK